MKRIRMYSILALAGIAACTSAARAQSRPAPVWRPTAPSSRSAVVNINTATEAELQRLPGVGPKLATAIYTFAEAGAKGADAKCDHRCHFKSVEDLAKVKGIGAKKLAELRPYVVVTGATTATAKIKAAKGGAK